MVDRTRPCAPRRTAERCGAHGCDAARGRARSCAFRRQPWEHQRTTSGRIPGAASHCDPPLCVTALCDPPRCVAVHRCAATLCDTSHTCWVLCTVPQCAATHTEPAHGAKSPGSPPPPACVGSHCAPSPRAPRRSVRIARPTVRRGAKMPTGSNPPRLTSLELSPLGQATHLTRMLFHSSRPAFRAPRRTPTPRGGASRHA